MSRNNEKIKLHIPQNFYSVFSRKHLLLDTTVFVDAYSHKTYFGEFFWQCKKNHITLVTIDLVVFEFCKGVESGQKLENKKEFISQIIDYILPLHPDLFTKIIPSLISEYREDGKKLSLTDLFLAATICRQQNDMVLLTRNHSDFPLNIFSLESNFIMEMRKSLQVYGIYGFQKS